MAHTPVIVVSAGAKAILDIEKTLEVLETRGVPVVVYGSDVMPAFWSRQSPHKAPLRLDDPARIARQVRGWASHCATCHGTAGIAQNGMESLAGVNKDDMVKKLMDFKTGKKPATLMHQLSKGYSDEQLQALAGYFAALKK